MFTKINLFLGTLAFGLALSAFSADSQAGRYRVEGPSGGNSGGQAGRYAVKADNVATGAAQNGWSQIGQSQVAGRYRQGTFAAPASHVEAGYAQVKAQRGEAKDVSNKPATVPACK